MSLPGGRRPAAGAVSVEIPALIAILEEETAVVKALTEAAAAKKEAIVARSTAAIEEAVKRESELLDTLQQLEVKRSAWVAHWASATQPSRPTGEANAQLSVSELAAALPQEQAEKVRQAAGELQALLAELDELNRDNASLLFHSLAFVQAMIDAITGAEEKTNVYGPKARPRGIAKATVEWRA